MMGRWVSCSDSCDPEVASVGHVLNNWKEGCLRVNRNICVVALLSRQHGMTYTSVILLYPNRRCARSGIQKCYVYAYV